MRSATIGTATAAVALTGLAVAPAAHADNVTCDHESLTSNYFGHCYRDTDDGDPGGLSGWAAIGTYSHPGEDHPTASFHAKGEIFHAYASVRTMRYKLQWQDSSGTIHTAVNKVLAPGDSKEWNLSLPEGTRVGVAIMSDKNGVCRYEHFPRLKLVSVHPKVNLGHE
ncbi:hypothetical protein [Streptomyces sp. NPDC017993]|uniref:hypothetical protein n=1 Tax=Streptomyces sp. NPDC017993 TaxID=3365027 RepID=UPI0037B44490